MFRNGSFGDQFEADRFELSTICRQFKLKAANNRFYNTDCANTEGMFRIIQSIPSPKAEPFKRWLAEVGAERLDEIENPELAAERLRQIYRAKGYSADWIERRLQSIVTRNELTEDAQGFTENQIAARKGGYCRQCAAGTGG